VDAAAWFTDTITVASQAGSTSGGDPIYGAQRAIAGTVKVVLRKQQTAQGTAVLTQSVFVTDQPIVQGDRLWLPGANTSSTAAAIRLGMVRSSHDKYGASTLYEVDL
jgi:hypothetical protein